jgi:hypothetical protein
LKQLQIVDGLGARADPDLNLLLAVGKNCLIRINNMDDLIAGR